MIETISRRNIWTYKCSTTKWWKIRTIFVDTWRQVYKAFLEGMSVKGEPLEEARISHLKQQFECLDSIGFAYGTSIKKINFGMIKSNS
jgi:hypothetical protein